MNHHIAERIQIISQFKSPSIGSDQSFENRYKKSKIWGSINFYMANILLIVLIVISASTLLGIEPIGQKWSKSGLMILMTLSLSLHAHYSLIEFHLLKHLKSLNESDFSFNQNLNLELKNLITDLNFHRFKPYWIIIPTTIVLCASALMVLELNPYWDMFVIPVLLIGILLSWRLNNGVFLIRENIEKAESKVLFN